MTEVSGCKVISDIKFRFTSESVDTLAGASSAEVAFGTVVQSGNFVIDDNLDFILGAGLSVLFNLIVDNSMDS